MGSQNPKLEIVTYSRGPCVQTVRTGGSVMVLFCITGGPLQNVVTTLPVLSDPYNIVPRIHEAPHPRNFYLIFPQFVGVGANFLLSLYGDPNSYQENFLVTYPIQI